MKAFRYVRPASLAAAARAAAHEGAVLKAGGTDLLDRMKERVTAPDDVVAVGEAGDASRAIVVDADGTLAIGAFATLADVAASPHVRSRLAALAAAAELAASPQIRHRATVGGNLCQRSRCGYYRLLSFPCLRRGDATCPVLEEGAVQEHAALFGNDACASSHPSSLAPVLCAAGARVVVHGGDAPVTRELATFWRAPARGDDSDVDLAPGAVVAELRVPPLAARSGVAYEEVRQRAAFDWALASCAARIALDGEGRIADAAVWLGSVAPAPFRAAGAEAALRGKSPVAGAFDAAAAAALAGARPLPGNAYKADLVRVVVRRALVRAAEGVR